MLITVVTAAFALYAVGGPVEMIQKLPHESLLGNDLSLPALTWIWIAMVFVKQIVSTNSMTNANRYLNARDTSHAKRAAALAGILFLAGSVIWFTPPLAASILYPDISQQLTTEVSQPSELAYVVIAQNLLPTGMIGLLIVGMFAATMSSMDSGLNKNAGFFVMNFYKPVLRKEASERELFIAGIITSMFFGLSIICIALFLEVLAARNAEVGLFEIMLNFGAMVAVPVAVPIILCLFIRRVPDWAGWSCALVGVAVAMLLRFVIDADWLEGVLGLELTSREKADYAYTASVFLNVTLATLWFFGTKLFYRGHSPERQEELDSFWKDIHTPVLNEEMTNELDAPQCKIIGWMATIFGSFMLLLMIAVPNSLAGRGAFLFCGLVLGAIGLALLRGARQAEEARKVDNNPA